MVRPAKGGNPMEQRFAGRVAVITGGASGIGAAIARRMAAGGARIALWDQDRTALAAAPADHRAAVDVTDAAAVARAAGETHAALGGLDILVASAGITGPNVPTWDYPLDAWAKVMDVNLNGVFHCCRAVVPLMRAAGWGRIVAIASIAGKEGNPNAPAYSASKAGVIGLVKSLGKELAGSGVCVNAVAPAAVETPLFAQMSREQIAFMLSKIPMGRFGTVDEVAALVCWLASAEAGFSTGAVFDCSGGRATY